MTNVRTMAMKVLCALEADITNNWMFIYTLIKYFYEIFSLLRAYTKWNCFENDSFLHGSVNIDHNWSRAIIYSQE